MFEMSILDWFDQGKWDAAVTTIGIRTRPGILLHVCTKNMNCVLVHCGFPVRRTMCGEAAVNLVETVFLEGDVLRQFLLGKIRCLSGLDIGMERAA